MQKASIEEILLFMKWMSLGRSGPHDASTALDFWKANVRVKLHSIDEVVFIDIASWNELVVMIEEVHVGHTYKDRLVLYVVLSFLVGFLLAFVLLAYL
ncbi:hypothetical protein EV714DRAFT_277775 [Schizophyllum commune]